jgi:hypothetical protein
MSSATLGINRIQNIGSYDHISDLSIQKQKIAATQNSKGFNAEIRLIQDALKKSGPGYKTTLCNSLYQPGKECSFRENCTFAHSLKVQYASKLLDNRNYKATPCEREDQCRFATNCRYIHTGDLFPKRNEKGEIEWLIYRGNSRPASVKTSLPKATQLGTYDANLNLLSPQPIVANCATPSPAPAPSPFSVTSMTTVTPSLSTSPRVDYSYEEQLLGTDLVSYLDQQNQ